MKKIYYIFALIAIALMFYNCDGSPFEHPYNPPGQITNVTFTPINGGGFFLYTIPPDETFLYVRAEYIIDSGERIVRTNSVHSDTLFISGLGTVREYEIRLFSVNRAGQSSQPVIKRITPLEPHTEAVARTVEVRPGFSSVIVNWENELMLPINVFVIVNIGDREAMFVHTSNSLHDRFFINDLEAEPHNVRVYIEDMYANQTEMVDFGSHTPLRDAPISKRFPQPWSFLRDSRLFGNKWDFDSGAFEHLQRPFPEWEHLWRRDSMRNAMEVNVEGRIYNFWDNVYDYAPVNNLNYFMSGNFGFPFSYFIDMGREIVASRVSIWPRDWGTSLFGGPNVQTFEIWISNDQDPTDGILDDWTFVGRYTVVQPSDPLEARRQARSGNHFVLFPDEPQFTRPFRYLRFKVTSVFGGNNYGAASEITLWGTEACGEIIDDPETLTSYIPGWES